MEDLLEVMYTRRSIREYTEEPVTDEQVETMLKAAMAAPSSEPVSLHFVVVRKQTANKLAETHKYAHMLANAPPHRRLWRQRVSERHWGEDTCAATQNLLLAVTALGGVDQRLPQQERMKYVSQVLPDDGDPVPVAAGHPAEAAGLNQ